MSTKNRIKRPALIIRSMEEAESHLAEFATADARKREITAKMEQRLTAIREEYADDLQELGEKCEQEFGALQSYFEGKPELFKQKKSIESAHATIGFRTGTPKLALCKGINWKAVLLALKAKKMLDYIRTEEEPDKERLLADRDDEKVKSVFGKNGIGCEVKQDEAFYITLKKEESAVV